MRLVALFLTVLLAACQSSVTQPDGSLIGTMTTHELPLVTIDGKDMRLAPGARIVGANNTSVTPNMVPPASRVRYKLDANGQVSQIWLLPADR